MKKFEILWELPKCDKGMKWANAAGKMAPIDLLKTGLLQTFNLQKMQHLPSAIKRSTIKQGMPVINSLNSMCSSEIPNVVFVFLTVPWLKQMLVRYLCLCYNVSWRGFLFIYPAWDTWYFLNLLIPLPPCLYNTPGNFLYKACNSLII